MQLWRKGDSHTVGGNVIWYSHYRKKYSVQFISVAQLCRTLCDPMNCSTPGLPVHLPYDPAIPFLDIYLKKQKH